MKPASFFLTALLALAVLPVGATVITVTPVTTTPTGQNSVVENQLTNGWSIVTNRFGIGELSPTGPSVAEREHPWNTAEDGSGIDLGRGAFYAACDYVGQGSLTGEDKTPSSVWLGLDTFNGQPLAGVKLSQIKSLSYWAYVSKVPTRQQDGSSPDNWDSWSQGWLYPSQPIMVQFTVRMPPALGYGDFYGRVQLQYRPWSDTVNSIKGDPKYEDGLGIWKLYDCLNSGRWMLSGCDKDAAMVEIPNWTSLLSYTVGLPGNTCTLGECELMATTTSYSKYGADYKSPGWNGTTAPEGWTNTSGTGKTLNFEVGARMSTQLWPGETARTNWARLESIGFRGQMDWFTLGIDKNGDGDDADAGEKFTYNFEPAATDTRPTITYLSLKDLARGGVNTIFETKQDIHKYDFLYKVSGRVTATGNLADNPWFELNDGSNISPTVRVYPCRITNVPGDFYPPSETEMWDACGFLEIPRWPYTVGEPTITLPYVLWSDVGKVQRLD